MNKKFTLIFTVIFPSEDKAGDAHINKIYKVIKDYIKDNTPYNTFHHDTKKIHSDIALCTNMRIENVEEKYLKLIDDFVENDIIKALNVNVVIEALETIS